LLFLRLVLEESAGDGVNKIAVPMFNVFFQMVTNIVTRLMLSKRMFRSSDFVAFGGSDFKEITVEVFRLMGTFNIGDYIPSLRRFDIQVHSRCST
jgi:hypothetical protein